MSRESILKGMLNDKGIGLEVGPSYNPILRKSEGYNVRIADYADEEHLRTVHPGCAIEVVDYVTHGKSILDVVGGDIQFDYILASHVIEHTVDLVRFFVEAEKMLNEGGRLVLAVPDKRRCFNVFNPTTTTGDVLQSFIDERKRHLPARIFDHHSMAASRGGGIVWHKDDIRPTNIIHSLAEAKREFEIACRSESYYDTHGWYFTPSSFRLILRDLHEMDYVKLKEDEFYISDGPEFYISFSLTGSGCPLERSVLLNKIIEETQEIHVSGS